MKLDGYTKQAEQLVSGLTLEEKIALLSGKDFWSTKTIGDIPSIIMTDGPHGVRLAKDGALDGLPATCFPTASALASTWNPSLLQKVGSAIGVEAQSMGVQVVLGPGVNMKRSPLAGRNFEYFSEDPYLAAQMAIAHITGLQSEGVGASLKHFAANNQEFERMKNSSDIDERTLHEIYLRAFELTVKQAQPWSLMASYNKINGTHATESGWLLQDILRDQWGHRGIVVSDWMAAAIGRPEAVKAGTHLEMPGGSLETTKDIQAAIENGSLTETDITTRAVQLVENILLVAQSARPNVTYDIDEHHALARRVASEAIVLLKNTHDVLPVEPGTVTSVAVIGLFAKHPRFQGGGSSQITPTKLDTLYDELAKIYGSKVTLSYAAGYHEDGSTTPALVEQALTESANADVTIVVTGLPAMWEFEGVDRPTLSLPDGVNELIERIAEQRKRTIVTLTNGSAVTMPWLERVDGVLEGWLTGQAGAGALADIITGRVNPSGRLSETFPARIEDTPPYPDFPNKTGHARYSEGIFIGYRWYDQRDIAPQFAFGYGLSYTTFEYARLNVSASTWYDDEKVTVRCAVKNSGKRAGQEVVQLYVSHHDDREVHPPRELKAFKKVELQPGQEEIVEFTLSAEDFAYYSEPRHAWVTLPGAYTVAIGRSSRDIAAAHDVTIVARHPEPVTIERDALLKELAAHPRGKKVYDLLAAQMMKSFDGSATDDKKKTQPMDADILLKLVGDMPIERLPAISNGLMTRDFIDGIVTYCRHETGFHLLESFAYYQEVAKLIIRAITMTRKKEKHDANESRS